MSAYYRKQNDTAQAFRYAPAYSDGTALDFSGATLRFHMRRTGLDEAKVDELATITSEDAFEYFPVADDVDEAGEFQVEWEVTYSNLKTETWPSKGYIACTIEDDIA